MHKAAFLTGYMEKFSYDEHERRVNAIKAGLMSGGLASILAASALSGAGKGSAAALSGAMGVGGIGGLIGAGSSYAANSPKNESAETVKAEDADRKLVETLSGG